LIDGEFAKINNILEDCTIDTLKMDDDDDDWCFTTTFVHMVG